MIGETGVTRWAPGAPSCLNERVSGLERAGAGWAIFRWDSGWRVYEDRENAFNPAYGADPDAARPARRAPMVGALTSLWGRNRVRPAPFLRR